MRPQNSIPSDVIDSSRKRPSSFVGINGNLQNKFDPKMKDSFAFQRPSEISENEHGFLSFDEQIGFGPPKHTDEQHFDEFRPFDSEFGNTDSSNFGPVIFDFDSETLQNSEKNQFKKSVRPSFPAPKRTHFSEIPGPLSFDSTDLVNVPSPLETLQPLQRIPNHIVNGNHRPRDDFNSLDARKRGRCEVFTENICLVAQDYPRSVRKFPQNHVDLV